MATCNPRINPSERCNGVLIQKLARCKVDFHPTSWVFIVMKENGFLFFQPWGCVTKNCGLLVRYHKWAQPLKKPSTCRHLYEVKLHFCALCSFHLRNSSFNIYLPSNGEVWIPEYLSSSLPYNESEWRRELSTSTNSIFGGSSINGLPWVDSPWVWITHIE